MLTYGLLAFAAAFVVVGIFRIIEFKAAGISRSQRLFLIPLHIIGCLLFAGATVLLAIDPNDHFKQWSSICFYVGILILFPLHIYVALKRRLLMRK